LKFKVRSPLRGRIRSQLEIASAARASLLGARAFLGRRNVTHWPIISSTTRFGVPAMASLRSRPAPTSLWPAQVRLRQCGVMAPYLRPLPAPLLACLRHVPVAFTPRPCRVYATSLSCLRHVAVAITPRCCRAPGGFRSRSRRVCDAFLSRFECENVTGRSRRRLAASGVYTRRGAYNPVRCHPRAVDWRNLR
jgi:hypothetical protein